MSGEVSLSEFRARRRRKYLSLGAGELVAATVFAVVCARYAPRLGTGHEVVLWIALAPLLVILIQAGVYWLLARGWVGLSTMPTGLARVYRLLRVLDPVLLVAALLGLLTRGGELPTVIIAVAIWLFAVAEYVNYFVVRLAYPATRWASEVGRWSRPQLLKDLDTSGS